MNSNQKRSHKGNVRIGIHKDNICSKIGQVLYVTFLGVCIAVSKHIRTSSTNLLDALQLTKVCEEYTGPSPKIVSSGATLLFISVQE